MILKVCLSGLLVSVFTFRLTSGGPSITSLEELCSNCNGTFEIRDDGTPHCVVSNDDEMDCAQLVSSKVLEDGSTLIPELKENPEQEEMPKEEDALQETPEQSADEGKEESAEGEKEGDEKEEVDLDEGHIDELQLVTASASPGVLEGTIFLADATAENSEAGEVPNESELMGSDNE